MDRSAKWIWPAGQRLTVDYHWLARREFTLPAAPAEARLDITACDRYRLIVNGQVVGEGPPPALTAVAHRPAGDIASLARERGKGA